MVMFASVMGVAEEKSEDAAKGVVAVEKLVVCTSVQDREPQGEAASFDLSVGKVYCWLLVTGAETEMQIKLGWWHKGNLAFECPLTVRSARFRTWGNKSLYEGGEWTVKVTDAEGHVLKEATFTVTGGAGEAEGGHSNHHGEKK